MWLLSGLNIVISMAWDTSSKQIAFISASRTCVVLSDFFTQNSGMTWPWLKNRLTVDIAMDVSISRCLFRCYSLANLYFTYRKSQCWMEKNLKQLLINGHVHHCSSKPCYSLPQGNLALWKLTTVIGGSCRLAACLLRCHVAGHTTMLGKSQGCGLEKRRETTGTWYKKMWFRSLGLVTELIFIVWNWKNIFLLTWWRSCWGAVCLA